jgi:hypothetical protein
MFLFPFITLSILILSNNPKIIISTDAISCFIKFYFPAPQAHRASVLSGERLDDRLGDRVGVLVEREVAAVEIAHLRCRHIPLHGFRGRQP